MSAASFFDGRSKDLKPTDIRFSQKSVSPWNGEGNIEQFRWESRRYLPVEVTKMEDGEYTTDDNRRVVASRNAGLPNLACRVHEASEEPPSD